MNVTVAIATVNRQEHLARLLECLGKQTHRPSEVIIAAPSEADLCDGLDEYAGWVRTTTGMRGLTIQRNAAIDLIADDAHVVLFLDDDMALRVDYINNCVASFERHPEMVGMTGELVLNGARTGTPITFHDADHALMDTLAKKPAPPVEVAGLYGCNFAVRASALGDLRFDERLPLYSWLEDLDFSRRLAAQGVLQRDFSCLGVHYGSPSGGRSQHLMLGYSQITNAIYLWRKGSVGPKKAFSLTLKPFAANALGSIYGHDQASRRARLRGNILSFFDIARGRLTPERIATL